MVDIKSLEPADYLVEALFDFQPEVVTVEDMLGSIAINVGCHPDSLWYLEPVAQDLINNDPRMSGAEALNG